VSPRPKEIVRAKKGADRLPGLRRWLNSDDDRTNLYGDVKDGWYGGTGDTVRAGVNKTEALRDLDLPSTRRWARTTASERQARGGIMERAAEPVRGIGAPRAVRGRSISAAISRR
jgi:hypothetical protein